MNIGLKKQIDSNWNDIASNSHFIEIKDFFLGQYIVSPPDNYVVPTNSDTGEEFPNCCPFHSKLLHELNLWFDRFPNCCKEHKAIVGKWWYRKDNYVNVPLKIVTLISYTAFLIENEIDENDWFERISEYIEYGDRSFGAPAIGNGFYLQELKKVLVKLYSEGDNVKIDSVIAYIEYRLSPKPKSSIEFDLEALFKIYHRWLKIFPFDITYFKDLKERLEKDSPFLNGEPKVNRYSNQVTAQLLSRTELINFLVTKTSLLLDSIDTKELIENDLISDVDKHIFDLISENHRIRQRELTGNFTKPEIEYITVINSWLLNETQYFEDIKYWIKKKKESDINQRVHVAVTLKKEIVPSLFLILRDFFAIDQQPLLEQLLNTGTNSAGVKLIFRDSGNRLADAFKQMYSKDLIVGCQKKDLQKWISENFNYVHRKKIKLFSSDYLDKSISRSSDNCKNPLFAIINHQLIKK